MQQDTRRPGFTGMWCIMQGNEVESIWDKRGRSQSCNWRRETKTTGWTGSFWKQIKRTKKGQEKEGWSRYWTIIMAEIYLYFHQHLSWPVDFIHSATASWRSKATYCCWLQIFVSWISLSWSDAFLCFGLWKILNLEKADDQTSLDTIAETKSWLILAYYKLK